MKRAQWILLALLLLLISTPAIAEPEIYLGLGGVTLHGEKPGPHTADYMPHKLDREGRWVYHPEELSLGVKIKYWQLTSLLLKDSFGQPAAFLGGGSRVELIPGLDLGLVIGPYLRRSKTYFGPQGQRYTLDDDVGGISALKLGCLRILPFAFVTTSYTFQTDSNPRVIISVGSNYALTHITFGVIF